MTRKQLLELTWVNKDKALIPTEAGRYGYRWVDPLDPRYCETHTLVLDDYVEGSQSSKDSGTVYSEQADLEPATENLMIVGESGDVLEALTRVPELANQYVGNVKLIYCDPPFNTAQTFANYEDNLEHSVWLTMMRDRLIHMHRLLSDDGSIWVHLDDVESHRMRVLLDEIFGAGNFVSEIAWQKVYAPENRSVFTQTQDTILLYAKRWEGFKGARNLLPRSASQDATYTNIDNDPRGPWKADNFTAQFNPEENPRESQLYELETPAGLRFMPPSGRCWLYTKDRYEELVADNRVAFGANGQGRPALKRFRSEVMDGRVPDSWWTYQDVGHNQTAKREIQALFPDIAPFSTPKPERLLERIIEIGSNPGDIVMDVFAGSGTTAAVAQKMGRRWVTCDLSKDTVERFTRPRLEKVVKDGDPGGVTVDKGERVPADQVVLPEGLSPKDAQTLTSLLNKALRTDDALKKSADIRSLKALVKTVKSKDTVNWRGGGGFHTAHLSSACFDYDEDLDVVMLTEAAEGETLTRAVAAHLRYFLTPEHPFFDGVKGANRLKVITYPVTAENAVDIVSNLAPDERVTIAATSVLDGARQALRKARRGSRIIHVPEELFRFTAEEDQR